MSSELKSRELGPRQITRAHSEAQMIAARALVVDQRIDRQWKGGSPAELVELDEQLAQLIDDATRLRELIARASVTKRP